VLLSLETGVSTSHEDKDEKRKSQDGAVFYWDHEVPAPVIRLAPSFGEFLALLQPFDMNNVHLKPGQVKRVWVNPEFLKRQKQKS
jgi:hypothetical protein